jgi:hypothetical protein
MSVNPTSSDDIKPNWLYNYDQAAALVGLNRYLIRNMVLDGRLPSVPISDRGVKRIRGRDLIALVNEGVQ